MLSMVLIAQHTQFLLAFFCESIISVQDAEWQVAFYQSESCVLLQTLPMSLKNCRRRYLNAMMIVHASSY
jgi:hypothetical protein